MPEIKLLDEHTLVTIRQFCIKIVKYSEMVH